MTEGIVGRIVDAAEAHRAGLVQAVHAPALSSAAGTVSQVRECASLLLRYAKGRGPFTTEEASARFGRDVERVLRALERADLLVRGELRPGG